MRLLYAVARPVYRKASGLAPALQRRVHVLLGMLRYELTTGPSVSVPLERRVWLWRRGFTSRADVLFDLTEENHDRYISDYQEGLTHGINGRWKPAIDNKLTAHALLLPFEQYLPSFFGVLDDGRLRRYPAYETDRGRAASVAAAAGGDADADVAATVAVDADDPDALPDDDVPVQDAVAGIDDLLRESGPVVLKPTFGAGGRGIHVVEAGDGGGDDGTDDGAAYRVNGEAYSRAAFADLVGDLEEYAVTEFVEQSAFMDELYAGSTNTIRVVTMWDYEADEPFVAWAHARVGTPESAPFDNLSQGGLQAGVDVDTGELLYAADISDKKPPIGIDWYDDHPATGDPIAGRTIPEWDDLTDEVLRMAEGIPQCPYVGWDVLPTDDGFAVIETNASPGMVTSQVHTRFMDDPRVRRFYEHHGVR